MSLQLALPFDMPPLLDLRDITYPANESTVVRISTLSLHGRETEIWRDWILLGQFRLAPWHNEYVLSASLAGSLLNPCGSGHGSVAAITLHLTDLKFCGKDLGFKFSARISTSYPEHHFRVPSKGYDPIRNCKTRCTCKNDLGYAVLPTSKQYPPFDPGLFEQVKGRAVEINTYPGLIRA